MRPPHRSFLWIIFFRASPFVLAICRLRPPPQQTAIKTSHLHQPLYESTKLGLNLAHEAIDDTIVAAEYVAAEYVAANNLRKAGANLSIVFAHDKGGSMVLLRDVGGGSCGALTSCFTFTFTFKD